MNADRLGNCVRIASSTRPSHGWENFLLAPDLPRRLVSAPLIPLKLGDLQRSVSEELALKQSLIC